MLFRKTISFALSLVLGLSALTYVEAQQRPINFTECSNYPPDGYKDSLELHVSVDSNTGKADWSNPLNDFNWNDHKQTFQTFISSAALQLVKTALDNEDVFTSENVAKVLKMAGPFGDEMEQISALLDANITDVLVYNYYYESSVACTSTVVNGAGGTIVHGRNLDFTPFNGAIFEMGVHVSFYDAENYKPGSELYQGQSWVGYVGLLTGMRAGAFSVSLNQRGGDDLANNGGQTFQNLVKVFNQPEDEKSISYALFFRTALFQKDMTYSKFTNAVKQLGDERKFVNSAYVIVGGVNHGEGMILMTPEGASDDQGNSTKVAIMGGTDEASQSQCTDQYCFQTNEDNRGGTDDSGEQFRYEGGVDNLEAAITKCPQITPSLLAMEVMTVCPTMVNTLGLGPDNISTVYTVAMNSAQDYFKGMVVAGESGGEEWGSPGECPPGDEYDLPTREEEHSKNTIEVGAIASGSAMTAVALRRVFLCLLVCAGASLSF